jgi:aminoglycoside 3-N-acetyltransferase
MKIANSIKFYARFLGRKYLPEGAIRAIRRPYQFVKSRKRAAVRDRIHPHSLVDLKDALMNAGFVSGDTIMVHSSLSRIGNVDGGAEMVIRSLLDTVTKEGTVVMPCYNSAAAVEKDFGHGRLIDLRVSPSATGKITEAFRTWPGVVRSSHPFSSSCAWGKQAEYMVSGHAQLPEVCHAESPVGRLVKLNGKVVGIGIPIAQGLGVAHYLEDTWEGFPFEVHLPPKLLAYIDSSGKTMERYIVRYDPKVSRTRIDHPEGTWICEQLTGHLQRKGILRRFRYGAAESWVMYSLTLYNELKRLAAKGITMYLTPDQLTEQNREVHDW